MSKEVIKLTPYENRIIGNYDSKSSDVFVVLDSSTSEFSVELPPLSLNNNVTFWIINVNSTGSGNDVTIISRAIDYTLTSKTLSYGEKGIFKDSFDNTYLSIVI